MIKSGTVFANDMYWHPLKTAQAFNEMGMRVCVGITCISGGVENFEKNLETVVLFIYLFSLLMIQNLVKFLQEFLFHLLLMQFIHVLRNFY